jgi:CheY-like chemotaxis protein
LQALLVGDRRRPLEVVRELLEAWGIAAALAADPAEALASCEARAREGRPFALLVVDIAAGEGGLPLIEKLRARNDNVPVLILRRPVGRVDDGARIARLAVAAQVTKPVQESELQPAVRRALAGRAGAAPADASSRPAATGSALAPLRILLAEDNMVNQRVAQLALGRAGHKVTIAGNGREAVGRFEGEAFDLVLMDVQMPEMGGFEATRLIREQEGRQPARRRTPIIALTAHSSNADRDRCLAAGMDAFISKPLDFTELFKIITEMAPAAPAAAPVWDPDALVKRLGIDRGALVGLVDLFRKDSAAVLAEIQQAVQEKDAPALRDAAHRMKGSSSVLSAAGIQAAAAKLEQIAQSADLGQAPEALAALEAATRTMLDAVATFAG